MCLMDILRQDLPHWLSNSEFCLQWPVLSVGKEDTRIIIADKHVVTYPENISLKIFDLLS